MGFFCSIAMFILSLATLQALEVESQQDIKSARLLDLVIRDQLFASHRPKTKFKTGIPYKVHLPSNLSGIEVDTVRFRCGSLFRYGANISEFRLSPGTHAFPCSHRVILVRQNLGPHWSSLYTDNYELSGYQLISPVLGLLAYDITCPNKTTGVTEVEIRAVKSPIAIDFTGARLEMRNTTPGIIPMCAAFDEEGKMSVSKRAGPNVCLSNGHGHFGLVVESPLMPMTRKEGMMRRVHVAVGISVGAALGGFLLTLLLVAVFVSARKKRKARMEEMERRAYEEEALRVSMVGHVRAVTASATRTMPIIEHFECTRPHPILNRSNS